MILCCPAWRLPATYTAETLSVTRGGWHQGTASRGLAEIALSTDLHKAMNAPAGTTFHVSGLHPALGDLGKTYPSVLHGVRNIAVHNHPRLPDVLWIRQSEDHALWRVPARSAAVPAWLCSLVL
jgi:hypothetical protein